MYFYEFHVVELRDDGQGFSLLSAAFFGLLFGVEALVCQLNTSGLLTKTSRLKIASKTTITTIQSGEALFLQARSLHPALGS